MTLDEFNAGTQAARNAYAADMAVQNGHCAVCKVNRRDGTGRRRCRGCRSARRTET